MWRAPVPARRAHPASGQYASEVAGILQRVRAIGREPPARAAARPDASNERLPVSKEIDRDRAVIGGEAPAGVRILVGPYDLPERRLVHPLPGTGAEYEEVDRMAVVA